MDRVEIRIGRRLVIRAAGHVAVLATVLGLLGGALVVAREVARSATTSIVWEFADPSGPSTLPHVDRRG